MELFFQNLRLLIARFEIETLKVQSLKLMQ